MNDKEKAIQTLRVLIAEIERDDCEAWGLSVLASQFTLDVSFTLDYYEMDDAAKAEKRIEGMK